MDSCPDVLVLKKRVREGEKERDLLKVLNEVIVSSYTVASCRIVIDLGYTITIKVPLHGCV